MFPRVDHFGADRLGRLPGPLSSRSPEAVSSVTITPPRFSREIGVTGAARRSAAWRALFLIGIAVALYFELFVWPAVAVLKVGTSGINLVNAVRVANGELMYRDFFQYTPPGTELVLAALIRLFGRATWLPNGVVLLAGIGYAWCGILIADAVLIGWSTLLPSALFMAVGFSSGLYPDHRLFSTGLMLAALTVLIRERGPARIATAGTLCGLALCFTQTLAIPVLAIALFLIWEARRDGLARQAIVANLLRLIGPGVAVVALVNGYFAWQIGIGRYLKYTVGFPLFYYRADTRCNTWSGLLSNGLPPHTHWYQYPRIGIWLFVILVLSLAPVAILFRRKLQPRSESDRRLILAAAVGLSLVLTVIYSPHYRTLSPFSLPAFVIFVWYLRERTLLATMARRLLWAGAIAALVAGALITQRSAISDQLNGRSYAFMDAENYQWYRWLADYVRPGQTLLDADTQCNLYYYLDAADPCVLSWLTPNDYTRPEQVTETRACLATGRVAYVLWAPDLDPGKPPAPDDHLEPLRQYLAANYHVVSRLYNDGVAYRLLAPNRH